VKVRSKLGEGTTFVITLPAHHEITSSQSTGEAEV
jgi:signal transduction histidine kinase